MPQRDDPTFPSGRKENCMSTDPAPRVLGAEEGEAFWFFGGLLIIKTSALEPGGRYALTEQLLSRGTATPLHRQPEDDESFYVLEGELTFYLEGGQPMLASAGSFVHAPAGAAHAYQVDSETARILTVTTAQHERFFRAASDPAQARAIPPQAQPDMEKVMAAAQEYGVEILGPPPGGPA
jgi:quercetin dioxygenase-like cupin family protein